MIEIARESYFFVHRGEIVHTPRSFESDSQLPGWIGDESSGILAGDQDRNTQRYDDLNKTRIINTENMTPEELFRII